MTPLELTGQSSAKQNITRSFDVNHMAWKLEKFDYQLENEGDPDASEIESVDSLIEWMEARIDAYESEFGGFRKSNDIAGRAYVARSIRYHSEKGLVQAGSAPSYFGDLWTLATCKKYMRGEPKGDTSPNSDHPFRRFFGDPEGGVLKPVKPLFILTFSSKDPAFDTPGTVRQRSLASVAMVTHGFNEMGHYADYLRRNFSDDSIEKRLSHGGNEIAEERGDCHADWDGNVYYPPNKHQHGEGGGPCECSNSKAAGDHIDNNPHHVKCLSLSNYWITWNEPTLAMNRENEFDQGHRNINGPAVVESYVEPVSR